MDYSHMDSNWTSLMFFFLISISFAGSECPPSKRTTEHRLYKSLTRNYDASSRPVRRASSAVNVQLSLSLHRILDLAEKNQTLISSLWIHEEWTDELLQWKPSKFDGLTSVVLPSKDLWLPDIYLFNNADKGRLGLASNSDSRVLVTHTGRVQWALPLIAHTACAVDVTYFPFDAQSCTIRFGSWIYDESQLNLSMGKMDMSKFTPNTELDLQHVQVKRVATEYEVLEGVYPQILLTLAFKRRPLYYAYTVIAPTLVLCIMALFSFLLPCDNGDKVGIGLTVFLSLYVLQLAIAENIPESNSLPLIGMFLTLVMTLNALSLVFATLVINLKKKGDRFFCTPVPYCLLVLCKRFLAKLTCTRFFNYHQFYGDCEDCEPPGDHDVTSCGTSEMNTQSTSRETETEFIDEGDVQRGRRKFFKNRQKSQEEGLCSEQNLRDLRYEWYFVAEVLDKTLFMFFVVALIGITSGPLIIVPWIVSKNEVFDSTS